MTGDGELHILLIEDNPGDVRLIEEMLRDTSKLLQRFDTNGQSRTDIQIHHEETLAAGLEHALETDVDIILLDLGLPDSTGLDTLTAASDATEFIPIIVLTGLSDESIGIKAIQYGAQDYLVKDEVTNDLLVRSIHYALERNRQERRRARRRDQLEALNRLNEISQDITHTVITSSTRDELERAVCERLVESDAYRFAWIGEVNRGTDKISPRFAAGVEDGYLDDITITISEGETSRGPAGKAVRTREVQVMQNVQTDPTYEPWRDEAIERGYRSSAAIPILHEDLIYGVLNIYASSPYDFSEPEAEILSRLGNVIGHAIAAIERKEALVSDRVLELEFDVEDTARELLTLTANGEGTITVENLVRTDDAVLGYGRAVEIPQDEFGTVLSHTSLIDEWRILSTGNDAYKFEIVTSTLNSLVDTVATHGGRIASVQITDGTLRFVAEFPPGRDKRPLIELVEDHCPGANNRAQRTVQRTTENVASIHSIFQNELTEKQRIALQTAHSAGLFEWPRKSTGEELADRLGIAPPTFSQHLRSAEKKVFDEVFAGQKD